MRAEAILGHFLNRESILPIERRLGRPAGRDIAATRRWTNMKNIFGDIESTNDIGRPSVRGYDVYIPDDRSTHTYVYVCVYVCAYIRYTESSCRCFSFIPSFAFFFFYVTIPIFQPLRTLPLLARRLPRACERTRGNQVNRRNEIHTFIRKSNFKLKMSKGARLSRASARRRERVRSTGELLRRHSTPGIRPK